MSEDNTIEIFENSKHSPYLKFKEAHNAEVFICLRVSSRDWDALPPQEFTKKYGDITLADTKYLLFLAKDQDGNHVPAELFDKTIKGKDGKPLPFREARRAAEKHLREWGVPVNFDPEREPVGQFIAKDGKLKNKYLLEGEAKHFEVDGRKRDQTYNYKNRITTGAEAPDLLHHNNYQGILTFRDKGDGLDSIRASREAHNFTGGFTSLKSESNIYHSETYIRSRSEKWNTPEHRFHGYLNEGHIEDLEKVLVGMPSGRYFEAEFVLKHAPDSSEAKVLSEGFSEETRHIRIAVRDYKNNTHVPIEQLQLHPGTLKTNLDELREKTGVAIHEGRWAETEIVGGREQLTKKAAKQLFDKYSFDAKAWVQDGRVLYPIDDPKITAYGPAFDTAYPRRKIFVPTVGSQGGRNGSFRNAASLTNDRIPEDAMKEIMARRKPTSSLSRFAPGNSSAVKKEEETAIALPQTGGSSSRFASTPQATAEYDPTSPPQLHHGTAAYDSNGTALSRSSSSASSRSEIFNRPPREEDVTMRSS